VKAQVVVRGRESALACFFIGQHVADGRIGLIHSDDAVDGYRVTAQQVIIVVGLLIDFGTVWNSRKLIDGSVFLHEAGIGSAAVSSRVCVIVDADGPKELRLAGEWGGEHGEKTQH